MSEPLDGWLRRTLKRAVDVRVNASEYHVGLWMSVHVCGEVEVLVEVILAKSQIGAGNCYHLVKCQKLH